MLPCPRITCGKACLPIPISYTVGVLVPSNFWTVAGRCFFSTSAVVSTCKPPGGGAETVFLLYQCSRVDVQTPGGRAETVFLLSAVVNLPRVLRYSVVTQPCFQLGLGATGGNLTTEHCHCLLYNKVTITGIVNK